MTTICSSRDYMVSDSRCSNGDACFETPKIIKIHNVIIGACGGAADCEKFLGWYQKKSRRIKFSNPDEFEALVLSADGLFLFQDTLFPIVITNKFHAIGSGGKAALGAMYMSASPEQAVEIAIKIDPLSGGTIVKLELDK